MLTRSLVNLKCLTPLSNQTPSLVYGPTSTSVAESNVAWNGWVWATDVDFRPCLQDLRMYRPLEVAYAVALDDVAVEIDQNEVGFHHLL